MAIMLREAFEDLTFMTPLSSWRAERLVRFLSADLAGTVLASWLADHAPDAAEVRDRAARQRAGYLGGYRGTMGMAYLALLAV
ncbi:MAG: hypothetical protein ACRDWT_14675 [Jatrophihabitantaceae bacterium]